MPTIKPYKDIIPLFFKMITKACKVLIDYDGVVLRSPKAASLVGARCTRFVSKTTGVLNNDAAQLLNKHMYQTHGHTLHGLRHMGYDVDTDDFNKHVYKNMPYRALDIKEDEIDLAGLLAISRDYETYIFSSAPNDWVVNTMASMGSLGTKTLDNIRFLPRPVSHLKPDIRAYCEVEDVLRDPQESEFVMINNTLIEMDPPEPHEFLLIDDLLLNVNSAVRLPTWKGMWITDDHFKVNDSIQAVRNLSEVRRLLS